MHTRHSHRLRKRTNHLTDISLTPLIDTALTLLVIFMVATPMLHNAIKISLPHGQAQEHSSYSQQEIVVYIDSNEDFYLDNSKMSKTELLTALKQLVKQDDEKIVYVKADRDKVRYGTVVELVDDIKIIGGVKYVALATQKHTQQTPSVG